MFEVFKVILDGAQATDGIHQIIMPEKEIPSRNGVRDDKGGGNDRNEAGTTNQKKCYYSRVCQRVLEI